MPRTQPTTGFKRYFKQMYYEHSIINPQKTKKRDIRKLNPALTDFLWIPDRNVQIKLVLTFLFLQLYVKKGNRKKRKEEGNWVRTSSEMSMKVWSDLQRWES